MKGKPSFADRRRFLKKYKRKVKDLINRYKTIDDTYDDIIDVFECYSPNSSLTNKISFLKVYTGEKKSKNKAFDEIYNAFCMEQDFYDIVRIFC